MKGGVCSLSPATVGHLFSVPSPESLLVQSLNEVDKAIIKVLGKNWVVS